MKKKLRDLSVEEFQEWVYKNCRTADCEKCLFRNVRCGFLSQSWVNHKDMYSNKFLDQEVDIPSPHILDKEEHDYLRAVVKPYKIKSITLIGGLINVCLRFRLENNMNEWFELPVFKKDTLYKGMEIDKEYSIQDLELDKEWEE